MGTTQSSPSPNGSEPNGDVDDTPAQDGNDSRERRKGSIDFSQLPQELTAKYEVLERIGSGSFGSVYRVRDMKTKVVYAAKYVDAKDSEVSIQTKLDDIHVVKIFDAIHVPSINRVVIVMEYCEGGNLLEWVKRNRRHETLNEAVILCMFKEICETVFRCHQKRIIHRDLKPENILLDSKRRIKLADFGVARVLHRKSVATSFCGTPPYMAPELFLSYLAKGDLREDGVGYDGKCDVWSIGCILWDMSNSSGKFVHDLNSAVGLNVAKAKSESVGTREITDLIDKDIPEEYALIKRFLRGMLRKDPDQRLSLTDILQDRELRTKLENPINGHWSDVIQ